MRLGARQTATCPPVFCTFKVRLYDEDLLKSDDDLGTAMLPIKAITPGVGQELSLDLKGVGMGGLLNIMCLTALRQAAGVQEAHAQSAHAVVLGRKNSVLCTLLSTMKAVFVYPRTHKHTHTHTHTHAQTRTYTHTKKTRTPTGPGGQGAVKLRATLTRFSDHLLQKAVSSGKAIPADGDEAMAAAAAQVLLCCQCGYWRSWCALLHGRPRATAIKEGCWVQLPVSARLEGAGLLVLGRGRAAAQVPLHSENSSHSLQS